MKHFIQLLGIVSSHLSSREKTSLHRIFERKVLEIGSRFFDRARDRRALQQALEIFDQVHVRSRKRHEDTRVEQ